MEFAETLAQAFPLMRGGGAFLVGIGLGILIGAFARTRKWRLIWFTIGVWAGIIAMAVGGVTKVIFAGLPMPAVWQWVVLGLAFVIEAGLVFLVIRLVKDVDSRQFWLWILFIVGAHFLILGFSHGPVCAALAVLCMLNAVIGLRTPKLDLRVFWGIDGALKVIGGALMIVLSYV